MSRVARGVVLSSALVLCAMPLRAQSFEGVVTVRIAARGGQSQEVEYLSRNGNVRISMPTPAGPAAMIALGAEQKIYMVLDSQRAYMEIPTGEVAATAAKAPDAIVTRTGRKETIAGYECEHVTVETTGSDGVQRTDACVAASLGRFISPMGGLGGASAPAWQRMLTSEAGFPLKVTMSDGTVALEVTKVEKKRVSDTQFRIPADYNKMDMPKRP